jgi:protein-disulfide isomerase
VGSLAGAYEQRVTENFKPGSVAPREPAKPDTRLWKVPVAGSPTLGPPDALVTIVQFQDLQCPFCAKVQATLDEVVAKYGDKVRIVFKHNPLPFHDRARPAAELAQYAFKKKGKDAFFGVARTLFLNQKDLTDQTFSNVASQFGLDPAAALASVHAAAFEKVIATDQQLASNLEARGTPHFFVNGHRLTGAQPLSTFVERIDAELATAEEALKKGIPKSKLYEYLTKEGLTETVPELKDVAAPPSNQPRMGAKRPQIEVQMFADLQCPFSARAQPTIRELMKAYPGRLSVVWRHMPLPFHEHAPLAGEALQEAFAQKGSEAFWKMAEILFANQDKLTFDDLLHVAGEVGLDQQAFKAALTDHRHRPIVEADMAVAKSIGVNGVPAFTINGYFISGAQGLAEYKRVVEYALKHPKK